MGSWGFLDSRFFDKEIGNQNPFNILPISKAQGLSKTSEPEKVEVHITKETPKEEIKVEFLPPSSKVEGSLLVKEDLSTNGIIELEVKEAIPITNKLEIGEVLKPISSSKSETSLESEAIHFILKRALSREDVKNDKIVFRVLRALSNLPLDEEEEIKEKEEGVVTKIEIDPRDIGGVKIAPKETPLVTPLKEVLSKENPTVLSEVLDVKESPSTSTVVLPGSLSMSPPPLSTLSASSFSLVASEGSVGVEDGPLKFCPFFNKESLVANDNSTTINTEEGLIEFIVWLPGFVGEESKKHIIFLTGNETLKAEILTVAIPEEGKEVDLIVNESVKETGLLLYDISRGELTIEIDLKGYSLPLCVEGTIQLSIL